MTVEFPQTIRDMINQLGGRQIFRMAFFQSVYEANADRVSLTLHVAPALKRGARCTHVIVTLDPSDTYRVEFVKVRGIQTSTIRTVTDVYCDNLREIVEEGTGLRLTMPHVIGVS